MKRLVASALPPLVGLLITLLAWELAVRIGNIERYTLPAPAEVAAVMADAPYKLAAAAVRTMTAALAGLLGSLLLGLATAVVFSQSALIRAALYPYAIFLQTVPVVAVAPLLILWLGYGLESVIAVSLVISLFPIIASATAGLTQLPPAKVELFRFYGASRLQLLWKLRLPHAVPQITTGLKTSAGLAVIGAIVGEFFVGYGTQGKGLGYLIRYHADQSRTPELFASVILATLLGVLIFGAVNLLGAGVRRFWYDPQG
jgi:NitT/TauT family transport system permease protein